MRKLICQFQAVCILFTSLYGPAGFPKESVTSAESVEAEKSQGEFNEQDWAVAYKKQLEGLPPQLRRVLEAAAEDIAQHPEVDQSAAIVDAEQAAFEGAMSAANVPVSDLQTQEAIDQFLTKNEFQKSANPYQSVDDPRYVRFANYLLLRLLKKQGPEFTQWLDKGINDLILPEIDGAEHYRVILTASFDPLALETNPVARTIYIPMGIILFADDDSQFFGVVAHEMTHNNPRHMLNLGSRQDLPGVVDGAASNIHDQNYQPGQREEIRADIGGTDRLIHAGHNPWGVQRLLQKLSAGKNQQSDPLTAAGRDHPQSDLRAAAIMAYVVARTEDTNLQSILKKVEPYPDFVLKLRKDINRLRILTHVMKQFGGNRLKWLAAAGVGAGYFWFRSATKAAADVLVGSDPTVFVGAPPELTELIRQSNVAIATAPVNHSSHYMLLAATAFLIIKIYDAVLRQPKLRYEKAYRDSIERYRDYVEKVMIQVQSGRHGPVEQLEDLRMVSGLFFRTFTDVTNTFVSRRVFKWEIRAVSQMYVQQLNQIVQVTLPELLTEANLRDFRNVTWNYILTLDRSLTAWNPETDDKYSLLQLSYLLAFLANEPATQTKLIALSQLISDKFQRRYHFADAERNFSIQRQDGELEFEYRLRLNRLDRDKISRLSPQDKMNLVRTARKLNLTQLTSDVVRAHYRELREYAQNAKTTQDMTLLIEATRVGDRVYPVRSYEFVTQKGLTTTLVREQKVAAKTDPEDSDRATAVLGPQTFNKGINQRNSILQTGEDNFRKRMDAISEVAEIRNYVDTNLVDKNVPMTRMGPIVSASVVSAPDRIRSVQDCEILFSRDYFWKRITSGNYYTQGIEALMISAVRNSKYKIGAAWEYDVPTSERMHSYIIAALRKNNAYPTTYEGLLELWLKLTNRGVTVASDQIAGEILNMVSPEKSEDLEKHILMEDRVWDPDLSIGAARALLARKDYMARIRTTRGNPRVKIVKEMLADLAAVNPSNNLAFRGLFEELSQSLLSTEEESALFEAAKHQNGQGGDEQDYGIRVLSAVLENALKWQPESQLRLIEFLRGTGKSFPALDQMFPIMGATRVQRLYQRLPSHIRTALVYAPFLNSPRGLMPNGRIDTYRGEMLLKYILGKKKTEATRVSSELLNALLYATAQTSGNDGLKSYVVGNILATEPSELSSPGDILRIVLSSNGALGVKIGQNIVAAEILPSEEIEKLRQVQDRANPPTREAIYEDLRKTFKAKKIPFVLLELLGSASLKYAFKYRVPGIRKFGVGKMLRSSALSRTDLEFEQLDHVISFLIKNYGAKYGILRAIGRASKEAVAREKRIDLEAMRSFIADQEVYQRAMDGLTFKVPLEAHVLGRLMVSEFGEGVSYNDLSPELQGVVAQKLLPFERDNLFADQPQIIFDPDRHAGNFRVKVKKTSQDYIVHIQPFDFGQLTRITRDERNRVLDLFAIAQVMAQVGPTAQLTSKVGGITGISVGQTKALTQALTPYLAADMNPLTAYYAVLAGLEDVGHAMPIVFFDFMRAILQLNQYEAAAHRAGSIETPHERLRLETVRRVEALRNEMSLTTVEKISYLRTRTWSELLTMAKDKMIPKRAKLDCRSALTSKGG